MGRSAVSRACQHTDHRRTRTLAREEREQKCLCNALQQTAHLSLPSAGAASTSTVIRHSSLMCPSRAAAAASSHRPCAAELGSAHGWGRQSGSASCVASGVSTCARQMRQNMRQTQPGSHIQPSAPQTVDDVNGILIAAFMRTKPFLSDCLSAERR